MFDLVVNVFAVIISAISVGMHVDPLAGIAVGLVVYAWIPYRPR